VSLEIAMAILPVAEYKFYEDWSVKDWGQIRSPPDAEVRESRQACDYGDEDSRGAWMIPSDLFDRGSEDWPADLCAPRRSILSVSGTDVVDLSDRSGDL
jgi:hypothetical protein